MWAARFTVLIRDCSTGGIDSPSQHKPSQDDIQFLEPFFDMEDDKGIKNRHSFVYGESRETFRHGRQKAFAGGAWVSDCMFCLDKTRLCDVIHAKDKRAEIRGHIRDGLTFAIDPPHLARQKFIDLSKSSEGRTGSGRADGPSGLRVTLRLPGNDAHVVLLH
jgi:hypothetical protein